MDKKTTAKKIAITLPVASSVTIAKQNRNLRNLKFSHVLQIQTSGRIFSGFQPDERQLNHRDHERHRHLAHEFVVIV
jgi:hypothetical protein